MMRIKNLTCTVHTQLRMTSRKISRAAVEDTIENGRKKRFGKISVCTKKGLECVIDEYKKKIVTVYELWNHDKILEY